MPDNVTYQSTTPATPPSGTKVSTDENVTSGQIQRVKLTYSADGDDTHIQADVDGLKVNSELLAPAALADDASNPTITSVGAFGLMFDGSTWDRVRGTSVDGLLVNLGANNDVTVAGTVTVDSELPTPALLNDDITNPTVTSIATFGLMYDGATWDRLRGTSANGLLVDLGANNDVVVTGTVAVTQSGTWVLGANSGVDIGDVTINNAAGVSAVNIQDGGNSITVDVPAGATTTFAKAEDSASSNLDVGAAVMAVRRATPANTSDADGDYEMLQMSAGRLWVDASGVTLTTTASQSGTWTVQPGNTANTTPWLMSIHDGTTKATVRDLASNDALNVAIVDGSGNQVTSFGGGTQYAEDSLHASGDSLTMAGVVQQSADAALSGDGDRSLLQVDATGYLKTTLKTALPAGTNNIGDIDVLTVPADPFGVNADAASATGSISAKLRFIAATGIPITGNVTVVNAGTFAVQDSEKLTDNGAFTDGTSKLMMAGYIFDEVAGTALTENDAAAARINLNRATVGVIEDGSTRARYATVTASNALKVDGSAVTQPVSIGATVTVDTELPTAATLADGTTNPSTTTVAAMGLLYNGSTWDRIRGDTTNGIDVDVTRVTGNVTVVNGGTFAVQDSEKIADNTAFTDGTSRLMMAGYIFDDVAGTALSENDAAAARVNANRAVAGVIEDGSTRGRYATVTASNAVKVDGSAVTQPVSLAAAASAIAKAEDSASGNLDVGVPSMAVRKATPVNTSDADGDYEFLQMSAGRLWVDASGVTLTVGSHAVTNAGTFAVQDSEKLADNAAFTDGTTKVMPVGFILDDTPGTSLAENDIGAPRMSSNRAVVSAIEDGATRARYATVTASNALKVDGSAVTQPGSALPRTSGGLLVNSQLSTAAAIATVVKASAGQVYAVHCFNIGANEMFFRLYNQTGSPGIGDTANIKYRGVIPGNTSGAGVVFHLSEGIEFTSGIGIRVTGAIADNDNTSLAANEVIVNVLYF